MPVVHGPNVFAWGHGSALASALNPKISCWSEMLFVHGANHLAAKVFHFWFGRQRAHVYRVQDVDLGQPIVA
ncbi:hypothetical protein [Nocardia sp. BMG51109]|uniref:hypothetical protein n=1 Tax=Nocardia sp. BMG51109 TaxID=1056816 RepID=UPI0004B447C3|nr:hypothetical protein [Nocardia sp. BMG51109]